MSTEANKTLTRRFIEDLWNAGNLDVADAILAPTFVAHNPSSPDQAPGLQAEKAFVTQSRTDWPDLRFTVEQLVAEGDLVTTRWMLRATHSQAVAGVAPTGRQVVATGISIVRIGDGRIVEEWVDWDQLGVLRQIGAIPAPAPVAS